MLSETERIILLMMPGHGGVVRSFEQVAFI